MRFSLLTSSRSRRAPFWVCSLRTCSIKAVIQVFQQSPGPGCTSCVMLPVNFWQVEASHKDKGSWLRGLVPQRIIHRCHCPGWKVYSRLPQWYLHDLFAPWFSSRHSTVPLPALSSKHSNPSITHFQCHPSTCSALPTVDGLFMVTLKQYCHISQFFVLWIWVHEKIISSWSWEGETVSQMVCP